MPSLWISGCLGLVLAPACSLVGEAAQKLKLPQITGYLIAGVLVGPDVLELLNQSSLENYRMLDNACLSLILFAAGTELHLHQLEKVQKQVLFVTLGIAVTTWLSVFTTMMILAPSNPMLLSLTLPQKAAVSSLFSVLMIARSPASAIAVIQETGGKGSFCSLVLAVTVVKDVVVIVLFSLSIEATRVMFTLDTGSMDMFKVLEPFLSVSVSLTIGIGAAMLLPDSLRACGRVVQALTRQQRVLAWARSIVLLTITMLVFWMATYFEAEPLLACAVAGLVAANTILEREGDELTHTLESLMPQVNLVFFVLAGASLKLAALSHSIVLGSIIVIVRLIGVYIGATTGSWLSNCSTEHRKRMWQSQVTQAGVALGLARMVAARFPTWGAEFQMLAASVVVVNLLIGPPIFRHAIFSTEENSIREPTQPTSYTNNLANEKLALLTTL